MYIVLLLACLALTVRAAVDHGWSSRAAGANASSRPDLRRTGALLAYASHSPVVRFTLPNIATVCAGTWETLQIVGLVVQSLPSWRQFEVAAASGARNASLPAATAIVVDGALCLGTPCGSLSQFGGTETVEGGHNTVVAALVVAGLALTVAALLGFWSWLVSGSAVQGQARLPLPPPGTRRGKIHAWCRRVAFPGLAGTTGPYASTPTAFVTALVCQLVMPWVVVVLVGASPLVWCWTERVSAIDSANQLCAAAASHAVGVDLGVGLVLFFYLAAALSVGQHFAEVPSRLADLKVPRTVGSVVAGSKTALVLVVVTFPSTGVWVGVGLGVLVVAFLAAAIFWSEQRHLAPSERTALGSVAAKWCLWVWTCVAGIAFPNQASAFWVMAGIGYGLLLAVAAAWASPLGSLCQPSRWCKRCVGRSAHGTGGPDRLDGPRLPQHFGTKPESSSGNGSSGTSQAKHASKSTSKDGSLPPIPSASYSAAGGPASSSSACPSSVKTGGSYYSS